MKSTRIKRLKTLQHLAQKHYGYLDFSCRGIDGEYAWYGGFYWGEGSRITARGDTFNEMLQALHTKVRGENL